MKFESGKSVVIIYGENGSGKSTICDGLDLLSNETLLAGPEGPWRGNISLLAFDKPQSNRHQDHACFQCRDMDGPSRQGQTDR